MINDYSQHGEGRIISEFFNNYTGSLVSLGENDGKTLSNVLGLIEVGWSGCLVEPSETAFNKLQTLHETNNNVKCFKVAIGESDTEMEFYESGTHLNLGDTSLLSSLDKNEITKWKKTTEFKTTKVRVKTWQTFLELSGIKQIDLISIDCEGLDYSILKQINLNKHGVKMVIVESNSVNNQMYIDLMAKQGMVLVYKNQCNLIFTK